jgi:hypothetical protein
VSIDLGLHVSAYVWGVAVGVAAMCGTQPLL